MKILAFLVCMAVAILLFDASRDFPVWGDPHSPANQNVSPYYIENSIKDTAVPNVVSAVLADYRSLDTMLETGVILIASIGVIFILRRSNYEVDYRPPEENISGGHNMIVLTVCRLLIPVMQLFALYVLIHGHHSPGGGFQGGVILAATLILHSLAFGLYATLHVFTLMWRRLMSYGGVLLFVGTGLVCLLFGAEFLNYGILSTIFPLDEVLSRSIAILIVECGVAMTVMSVLFTIYVDLASSGDLDKGL